MTKLHNSLPEPIVRHWLENAGIQVVTPVPPGMSGAVVYRCDSADGRSYALKRWPSGAMRSRLDEVHSVMQGALADGCDLVPEVCRPAIEVHQHCWDLVQWMPGEPLSISAPIDEIARGAAAIARFHACTATVPVIQQVAPAITDRLRRLAQLDRQIDVIIAAARQPQLSPSMNDVILRAVQLLSLQWKVVQPKIYRSLARYADRKVATQYVLRDVHREHLLFAGTRPSGLIDFDAVRIDTPAVDLARWVGSDWIAADRGDPRHMDRLWNAALAGYATQCPSKESSTGEVEADIARILHPANIWISLANWLVWVLIEQRSFPAGESAVIKRISALTDSAGHHSWVK